MIVYGDHPVQTTLHTLHATAAARLAEARAAPPGLPRHSALATAFLARAECARAHADALFAEIGEERPHPEAIREMAHLVRLAQSLRISWRTRFRRTPVPPDAPPPADRAVTTKPAEGFAFYALYPEAVLDAAQALAPGRDTLVIGLRGIGVALAALAAATLRPRLPPMTLRPVGLPFAREILGPLPPTAARALVLDEGPGLSGSSFAAAARWAQAGGIAPARIHLLTSHANPPGDAASPDIRARFADYPRVSARFETSILPELPRWTADLLGEPLTGWEDLSAGAWADAATPTDPARERLKYRATTRSGRVLVKFAGLGETGPAKLARARALEQHVTPPLGLVHGFLVERWIEPGPAASATFDELAGYLAARAALAPPNPGASLAVLIEMARANIAEALGEMAAAAFAVRAAPAAALASRAVAVDGRLHPWEWLRDRAGRLVKADALDHCEAHDLIGCQDIAWDIAGAATELGADPAALTAALGADARLVALHRLVYPAFQLGLWTRAEHARAAFYADVLRRALSGEPPRAVADR